MLSPSWAFEKPCWLIFRSWRFLAVLAALAVAPGWFFDIVMCSGLSVGSLRKVWGWFWKPQELIHRPLGPVCESVLFTSLLYPPSPVGRKPNLSGVCPPQSGVYPPPPVQPKIFKRPKNREDSSNFDDFRTKRIVSAQPIF